jgi:hypothetical protein
MWLKIVSAINLDKEKESHYKLNLAKNYAKMD